MPSFRTKARAVELLGKGQIADLPTAISELWKNGYDAYGDKLSCDLYLKGFKGLESPIFTLSDDGTGMSRKDLEERWIVLGTDSKIHGGVFLSEEERFGKTPRIQIGEKGIGRLSVAYLGSRMLMLTKKRNEKCQAIFMDWRVLENNNLFLDDIDVPMKDIKNAIELKKVLLSLLDEFEINLHSGDWKEHANLSIAITSDLKKTVLPEFLIEETINSLIESESHGTMFVIFDPHEQLITLSAGDSSVTGITKDDSTNYLRASLCGVFNAFKKEEQDFSSCFWIHSDSGKYDIVSKENFFEKSDITNSDHWFIGKVDENGLFEGKLKIFNEILDHRFRPVRPPGITPYGPLEFEFGFIEGEAKSSILPREQWDAIYKKLSIFGGMYVYRDNFRILPYGRPDVDWLEFERRRTLGAAYYMFSHRRMLGYIAISREKNTNLKDRASREGFIDNKAYRELRNDLISFFIDLSVRYMRATPEGEALTLRWQQLESIQAKNLKLLETEKKKDRMTLILFKQKLSENTEKLSVLENEIEILGEQLEEKNKEVEIVYNEIASIIDDIENKKNKLITLRLEKPKRANISKSLEGKYLEFVEKYETASELAGKCDKLISVFRSRFEKEDLEKELISLVENSKKRINATISDYVRRFRKACSELENMMNIDSDMFKNNYDEYISAITPSDTDEKENVSKKISSVSHIYDEIVLLIRDKYDSFLGHVEQLGLDVDDDLLVGWYKNEYEKIEKKIEGMHELAQLGLAIEIIDHQFNVLYSELSASIKYFKKFSNQGKEQEYYYKQLKTAFDHLETNHQMLTPLYRTTRRIRTEIKGSDILFYLREFFKNKFEKDSVNLTSDQAFDDYVVFTYDSVIKPVFINILNNALFWLIPSNDRRIHITYENEKILIMNSGERIPPADIEDIFTLFFTRKPGGRGIGLYLARTNLASIGYYIYATNDKKLNRFNGACFVIEKSETKDKGNEHI